MKTSARIVSALLIAILIIGMIPASLADAASLTQSLGNVRDESKLHCKFQEPCSFDDAVKQLRKSADTLMQKIIPAGFMDPSASDYTTTEYVLATGSSLVLALLRLGNGQI